MGTVNKDEKHEIAWACRDCGHIMGQTSAHTPSGKCPECHTNPAHWLAAEITGEPIDKDVPHVADYRRDEVSGNDPAALFATSPPGSSTENANPEVKVRY